MNIQEQNGKNTTAGQNRSRIEEIIEDRKRGQENTVREELQKQKEARTGRVKQSIILETETHQVRLLRLILLLCLTSQ